MSIFIDLIVLKDTKLEILLEWVNHYWGLSLRLVRYPVNEVWMKGTQYFPEAATERFGFTANVAIKAIQMFCAPMHYRSLVDEAQDAQDHGLGENSILIGCRVSINPWYMDTY